MKKIILFTLALFATVTCFARNRDDEDNGRTNSINFTLNTDSDTALLFNFGDTFYNTERLSDCFKGSKTFNSNGFTGEIGTYKSDEDGLFDFVQTSLFGFGGGKIQNIDNIPCRYDNIEFLSDGNPKHYNFYFKETFGLQLNVFFVSFGVTTGPKVGYDWMKMPIRFLYGNNISGHFHENRVFLDWTLNPYISFNLNNVKIFLSANSDFPVLRARFQYTKSSHYKSDTTIKWDWFKNDVPITYMVGCAIFF